jgi:hypothetical protein
MRFPVLRSGVRRVRRGETQRRRLVVRRAGLRLAPSGADISAVRPCVVRDELWGQMVVLPCSTPTLDLEWRRCSTCFPPRIGWFAGPQGWTRIVHRSCRSERRASQSPVRGSAVTPILAAILSSTSCKSRWNNQDSLRSTSRAMCLRKQVTQ